jgi:NDP-sugar pyrophosphorylase family protein
MQAILNLTTSQHLFDYSFCGHSHGMLPVADKPFAAYLIDQMKEQGYEKVFIISKDKTEAVNQQLGNGDFWSLSIEYINSSNNHGLSAYYRLLSSGIRHIRAEDYLNLGIYQTKTRSVATLNSYLDKSLAVVSDQQHFQLAGFQIRPNVFLCEGAKTKTTSDYPIHLGKYAQLKRGCKIYGPSIIGSGSIIESGNLLDNTVVMPNTHVGSNLDLSNCLVTPHWIYHRITQGMVEINEAEILSAA